MPSAPARRAAPDAAVKTSDGSRALLRDVAVTPKAVINDRLAVGWLNFPALVCKTQHAIRFREPPWPDALCDRVAGALAETREPMTMLAVAIVESDLRAGVASRERGGVVDVGLAGVRCHLERGRCTNGPAAGFTMRQLFDPATNIRVASAIMEAKRARHGRNWLQRYNGGTREHGYAGRIAALVAALGGVEVKTKDKRIAKLVRQIAAATQH